MMINDVLLSIYYFLQEKTKTHFFFVPFLYKDLYELSKHYNSDKNSN